MMTIRKSVAERQEEILGQPPRIPPLDRQAHADQVRAATRKLRAGILGEDVDLPVEAIPEIMFVMGRFTDIWDKQTALALQIQSESGVLPPRDRQLAILRTAWLLQAPYEWGQHVQVSKGVGISSEEIERVTNGSSAVGWTAHEAALLRAAEELRENVMVSDATWETLAQSLNDHQMFELLVLIGQFTATAYYQNSLRLRLERGNSGLDMR